MNVKNIVDRYGILYILFSDVSARTKRGVICRVTLELLIFDDRNSRVAKRVQNLDTDRTDPLPVVRCQNKPMDWNTETVS